MKEWCINLWIWYLEYLSPLYFHHRYLIRCIDKPRIESYDYVVRATGEKSWFIRINNNAEKYS